MAYVPWPGFGPYESWDPEHTVEGGETLELAGLTIDVVFTPGHSPGHVIYARPRRGRAVLRRRPLPGLDRAHRPARRRHPDAHALDRDAAGRASTTTRVVHPGHMGLTTLGAERATNPFLTRARESGEREAAGAARHVRRAAASRPTRARALEATARRVLEGAGYRRIETPTFEATELFARGVGASTDIVQKEMYTFDDGGGRSLTLRPEGTAPICRAYVEHGMHKLPQPVKLWYLSSFFRDEKPQAGRYRQFWQVGAEAIGSDDPAVDAEPILLLRRCSRSSRSAGCACACRASARRPRARPTARSSPPTCAPTRTAVRGRPRAHRPQPAARVRLRPSGHARGHGRRAPLLLDHLDADDAEHFADGPRAARRRRPGLRGRPDARARAGLLHAHGLRVHLRRARRAERRRRRRALRRARRAARRARRRRAAAGPPGSSGCCWPPADSPSAPAPVDLFVAYDGAARAPRLRAHREARRARLNAQMELAGRSLKGQLKQADRLGARYVAIARRRRGSGAEGHGERRAARTWRPARSSRAILRDRGMR